MGHEYTNVDKQGLRFSLDLCAIEGGGSGLKPLLQKPSFCRSGFRRDPCVIENQELGVAGAAFIATLASSKTEVRGESPSYRTHLFVGAASAATLCVIENQELGVAGAAFIATLVSSRTESSGRKPLLQNPSFCRSGFRRDPCVIENQELGVAGAAFTATLASSGMMAGSRPA
jgi:hypothetical protein